MRTRLGLRSQPACAYAYPCSDRQSAAALLPNNSRPSHPERRQGSGFSFCCLHLVILGGTETLVPLPMVAARTRRFERAATAGSGFEKRTELRRQAASRAIGGSAKLFSRVLGSFSSTHSPELLPGTSLFWPNSTTRGGVRSSKIRRPSCFQSSSFGAAIAFV